MDTKNNQHNNNNTMGRVVLFSLALFIRAGKKKHLECFVTYLCTMFVTIITVVISQLLLLFAWLQEATMRCLKIIWCMPILPCHSGP